MKILLVWPNKDTPFYRPISISLFSAMLKKTGHEVKCFDTSFVDFGYTTISDSTTKAKIHKKVDLSPFNLEKKRVDVEAIFLNKLRSFKPDVIAFTVISDEVEIAKKLSEVIKKWDSKKIIIWGGKGVLVEPKRILLFSSVDYICMGEGIIAFPEFIRAIEQNKSIDKIKNIWYKKGTSIIKNDLYPLFDSLDNLPYLDWDIFDKRLFYKPYEGKVYRGGDHMISWGCPNNCSYCINDYYHKLYGCMSFQRYSPKRIIAELKYLTRKYNIEFYKFHDEDFLLKPPDYFEELVELYAKEVNVPFTCMANSKFVTEKGVQLLKRMNCVSVSLGIETGDEKLRKDVLNRRDTKEEIIKAFNLLRKNGIRASAFNMLGIPFETRDTYFKTVELNREANVQAPHMGFFFPFKKTRLRDIAIENGFYDPKNEKIYNPDLPALQFKKISEDELVILRNRFVLYVKLPKVFQPFIKRSENMDKKGKNLEKILFEIYNECVFAHDGWFNDNGKLNIYINKLKFIAFSVIL